MHEFTSSDLQLRSSTSRLRLKDKSDCKQNNNKEVAYALCHNTTVSCHETAYI